MIRVFWGIVCLICLFGLLGSVTQAVENAGVTDFPLCVTEVMMNPLDPNAEFIEVANLGTESLSLAGVRFVQGISYQFGNVSLAPGEYAVLVRNLSVFQSVYGQELRSLGQYQGSLDNGGEQIVLIDGSGKVLADFEYQDNWEDLADGEGFSLVQRDETAVDVNLSEAEAWRSSTYLYGSPATVDPNALPAPGSVVVNEVLANSGDGTPDWIELLNTSSQSIALGGWWLSDDTNDYSKYTIPAGVTIAPGAFLVFNQDNHFDFGLADAGDTVVLQAGIDGVQAGYRQVESFGASLPGVSLGRHLKSTGTTNFVAMTTSTPGAANALPQVGSVVISEIMYHPADNSQAEYVELLNTGTETVALYDVATQQLWRLREQGGGIDYTFSASGSLRLAPGERLLLVRDQDAFSATYTVPVGVTVLEWGTGALGNGGDQIQLDRFEALDEGINSDFDWIRVERVSYSDGSHPAGSDPWPTAADGDGMALERIDVTTYGNDPANWRAANPTPGF